MVSTLAPLLVGAPAAGLADSDQSARSWPTTARADGSTVCVIAKVLRESHVGPRAEVGERVVAGFDCIHVASPRSATGRPTSAW